MRKVFSFILLVLSNILIVLGCAGPTIDAPVDGVYDENKMKSLINPPKKIPCYLRPFVYIADKTAKKQMLIGRVLAWSPKISISSGLLELYVEKEASRYLETRMLTILRMIVSYTVPSPFALDINSQDYKKYNITNEELEGLQGVRDINSITSFSEKEKAALQYAHALSITPIVLTQKQLDNLRCLFSEKEIVAIAALTAKVNYWARLFEALRIKPAGFTDDSILHIEDYNTLEK